MDANLKHVGELVTMPDVPNLTNLLECPICKEIPCPPIYLCAGGHSLCHFCKNRVAICSLCQSRMTTTRNFFMEDLISNCTFTCMHEGEGCREIIKGGEMKDHLDVCPARMRPDPALVNNNIPAPINPALPVNQAHPVYLAHPAYPVHPDDDDSEDDDDDDEDWMPPVNRAIAAAQNIIRANMGIMNMNMGNMNMNMGNMNMNLGNMNMNLGNMGNVNMDIYLGGLFNEEEEEEEDIHINEEDIHINEEEPAHEVSLWERWEDYEEVRDLQVAQRVEIEQMQGEIQRMDGEFD